MPLTLKMVASEILMCGLKQAPVVGTAFEVVDAIRASHAKTVVDGRLADIEDQLTRWEKRQRDLVAEEIQTILGNLAWSGMDGASLTEEIRNLRQIQEQGWNPSLFEGLMLNSTHLAELKRNPQPLRPNSRRPRPGRPGPRNPHPPRRRQDTRPGTDPVRLLAAPGQPGERGTGCPDAAWRGRLGVPGREGNDKT